MLNLLELALNNNYIYIGIISILVIVIIITALSIRKDRAESKKVKPVLEEISDEDTKRAKLELEKVVNEMQKNIDNENKINDDIKTYEEEQEEHAIISYQELVEAVKGHEANQPHKEVGMEVADTTFIEEDGILPKETEPKVDSISQDATISEPIEVVLNTSNEVEEKIVTSEVKPYEEKKFKKSEVISPVFGLSNQALDDEEDEFLDSLKDFRKNL